MARIEAMNNTSPKFREWLRALIPEKSFSRPQGGGNEGVISKAWIKAIMIQVKVVETELSSLLAKEELYWSKRSRADWLRARNKNSKFFHSKASARKKKNTIMKLIDENGVSQTKAEGINRIVCKYFSNIFTSNNPLDRYGF
ncbi:hypothetical protein ACOSP7_013856 [Xanthoceras sorbifolium]